MGNILVYLLPLIIKALQEIADALVNGEKITEHQVMLVQSAYFELNLWGMHLAADTANTYDDQAVASLIATAEDILKEAGKL